MHLYQLLRGGLGMILESGRLKELQLYHTPAWDVGNTSASQEKQQQLIKPTSINSINSRSFLRRENWWLGREQEETFHL